MHVDSAERQRRGISLADGAGGGHGHVAAAAARHGGHCRRLLLLGVQHLPARRGEAAVSAITLVESSVIALTWHANGLRWRFAVRSPARNSA